MGRRGCPGEFRQRVLDQIAACRPVRDVPVTSASASTRCSAGDGQERMNQGIEPGSHPGDQTKLSSPTFRRSMHVGTRDGAAKLMRAINVDL